VLPQKLNARSLDELDARMLDSLVSGCFQGFSKYKIA